MGNIFKFNCQKLAINNNCTLLYEKFFIKSADFDYLKKEFLICEVFLYMICYLIIGNSSHKEKIKMSFIHAFAILHKSRNKKFKCYI